MLEIKLKPIPEEEIKKYFGSFGRNWWKELPEKEKLRHKKKQKEGLKKSWNRRKKKNT